MNPMTPMSPEMVYLLCISVCVLSTHSQLKKYKEKKSGKVESKIITANVHMIFAVVMVAIGLLSMAMFGYTVMQ